MGSKAQESVLTSKERKKLLKQPVPMRPDAPENIRLSKAQFIAKRQEENEEALAVAQFKKDFKAGKVTKPAVEEEKEETPVVEVKNKGGRPKKVD